MSETHSRARRQNHATSGRQGKVDELSLPPHSIHIMNVQTFRECHINELSSAILPILKGPQPMLCRQILATRYRATHTKKDGYAYYVFE